MAHLTSILAATDFSDAATTAIAQAARLANATGAQLHVLHTASSGAADELAAFFPDTQEYGFTDFLDALRERIAAQLKAAGAPETARIHVNTGNAFRAIVAAIEEFRPDLLVIGSTGVSGRRLGTIGGKCVRKVACDVLLIPAESVGPFMHITACIDFSDLSPVVLQRAAALSGIDNASLVALYANERVDSSIYIKGPSLEQINALPGIIAARFDNELRHHTGDLPVTLNVTTCDSYSTGIVRFAEDTKTDLVVTGTTGRSRIAYMLLGTTAEKVIREVGCAVLAVKPTKE